MKGNREAEGAELSIYKHKLRENNISKIYLIEKQRVDVNKCKNNENISNMSSKCFNGIRNIFKF